MKTFEQLAQAGYAAYRKTAQREDNTGAICGRTVPTWIELEADQRNAWIDASKQIAAEIAARL